MTFFLPRDCRAYWSASCHKSTGAPDSLLDWRPMTVDFGRRMAKREFTANDKSFGMIDFPATSSQNPMTIFPVVPASTREYAALRSFEEEFRSLRSGLSLPASARTAAWESI
jgi:hypothetical protein